MKALLERFERVNVFLPRRRDTLALAIGPSARWRLFRRSQPLSSHA